MAQFFRVDLSLLASVGVALMILFPFFELFNIFKIVEVEIAKQLLEVL